MKLVLGTGREIELVQLDQRRTYEGLIEGLPTTRSNAAYLQRLIQAHTATLNHGAVLIEPVESLIEWPADRDPYPFGTPAQLPDTTCVGRWRSKPVHGEEYIFRSELVVIWLQEEFALPVPQSVQNALESLDWDGLAVDIEI